MDLTLRDECTPVDHIYPLRDALCTAHNVFSLASDLVVFGNGAVTKHRPVIIPPDVLSCVVVAVWTFCYFYYLATPLLPLIVSHLSPIVRSRTLLMRLHCYC